MTDAPHPFAFFEHLRWIDGRPLMDTIEPYRRDIFERALYSFDPDGRPTYNQVLSGRAKKNWKSSDLVLAAFYRLFAWPTPGDCYLLGNDEDQASDDLSLAKLLLQWNPSLQREAEALTKAIRRRDGRGDLRILPARDVAGSHGKTYSFCGFDEIHAYRNWDLFEALAPDPTRLDSLTWITSYASIYNAPGNPLYDLIRAGKRGEDPRMLFSWYAGDYTTDPAFADAATPEERANPSASSWNNPDYLPQQRRRLPTHKYRRLHLNLPGTPSGAYLDADSVIGCIVEGRRSLPPVPGIRYKSFVDMSGGSADDACLGIAHREDSRIVLDVLVSQTGKAPFNPRAAVKKFAEILKRYGISSVTGDAYAGMTFRLDFEDEGIAYRKSRQTKSELYEELEPVLNSGEAELLDIGILQEQLLTLVMRGKRIDHQPGDHDDWANAAAGAIFVADPCRVRWGVVLGSDDAVPMNPRRPQPEPDIPEEEWESIHEAVGQ